MDIRRLLKRQAVMGLLFASSAMFATLAQANILTGASATANCAGYTLTVRAADLSPGVTYTIKYTLTLTSGTGVRTFPGTIAFTATAGTANETASANQRSTRSSSHSNRNSPSPRCRTDGFRYFTVRSLGWRSWWGGPS